jgi:hypothetical protein
MAKKNQYLITAAAFFTSKGPSWKKIFVATRAARGYADACMLVFVLGTVVCVLRVFVTVKTGRRIPRRHVRAKTRTYYCHTLAWNQRASRPIGGVLPQIANVLPGPRPQPTKGRQSARITHL